MSRLRRALEAVAGLAGLFAAVAWLSGGCERRVAPGEVDVPAAREREGGVAVVEDRVGPAVEWASGEVASARHTAVASRVLARIDEVRVSAGSSVSEGDVLLVLDARDLAARAAEAEQALLAAQARLELAQREQARVEELVKTGVAAQRRLDETTSTLRAAQAEVAGSREALEDARTGASFAEIRSPVSGRVIDRLAEPGDTAVPGRPLLRIYDPTLLRVEAPVRESLAVGLTVGDVLRVEIPALAEPVDGRVDEIVPFAERGARTLLVKVSLPRTDARLFAGMFARVAIPAGEQRRLLVPAAAIERVGQLEFVTVLGEGGKAERRLVTSGESAGPGVVEVLSGLHAGERVQLRAGNEAATHEAAVGEAAPVEAAQNEAAPVEAAGDDVSSGNGASQRPAAAAAAVARLRDELGAALRQGLADGPEAAIDACRVEAPRIARELASDGLAVGRTSDRLRNPANAPEPWMLALLEEYRTRPPEPGSFRTVDLGPRGTGYVEPIYLQPLCATCHGEAVDPSLLSKIRANYPSDAATGFRVGELRGLFWAVVGP